MFELYRDLNVDIDNWINLRSIDSVMSLILSLTCNDRLEFIVDQGLKHEMSYQRPNSSLNVKISQFTYTQLLNGILRVSSTSIRAPE